MGNRIAWQQLLPQAALTSLGLATLTAASLIYLPRAISSAATQFGFIGVAFALLSLLFLAALVLVMSAALGATLTDSTTAKTPPLAAKAAVARLGVGK